MIWSPILRRDLSRLRRIPALLSAIHIACDEKGLDPYLLAAIALRESGAGWSKGYVPLGSITGWGDKGNAFGIFQIDKRYHAEFLSEANHEDLLVQAQYAAALLAHNRSRVLKHFPYINLYLGRRAYCDAYNAGFYRVKVALTDGLDPDSVTTGKDYGTWVVLKSGRLKRAVPNLFT